VGLILDLAVVGLALIIIGSLGSLAWTIGISAVRATRLGRRRVAGWSRSVVTVDGWLQTGAPTTSATLASLAKRTRTATSAKSPPPGDEADA